jgi:phosphoribosylanthranilate isomerase
MLSEQDKEEIRVIAKEEAEDVFQKHNDSALETMAEISRALPNTLNIQGKRRLSHSRKNS